MKVIGAQVGLDREEQVLLLRAKLTYLFRTPLRRYRLNDKQAAGMGRVYSEEAIDAGEVLYALTQCTPRQQRALALCLGRGIRAGDAARILGVSRATVNRDIADALDRMRALAWEET